jgi:hypothetical protein
VHPADAVRYLLHRGLFTAEDVVDGRLTADDAIGRNDNLLLRSRSGRAWAFKHAADGGMSARMLALEAQLYQHLAAGNSGSAGATLGAIVPPLALFDAASAILVTGILPDTRELWELEVPHGALPAIGGSLGGALAACHAVPADDLPPSLQARRAPWVLGVHRQDQALFRDAWPAQVEVVRLVQANPAVGRTLDALRNGWQRPSLIHGDVKLSNILVRTRDMRAEAVHVLLIDWETAAAGDPAWDVGSVYHTMLWHALHQVFNAGEEQPEDPLEAFAARLPLYQREMRTFHDAYGGARSMREPLERIALCCGARLVQSAYEEASGLDVPSRFALALLQLGVNVLAAPGHAARQLLAMEADA